MKNRFREKQVSHDGLAHRSIDNFRKVYTRRKYSASQRESFLNELCLRSMRNGDTFHHLVRVYVAHSVLANRVIPSVRFNVNAFSETECKSMFRFTASDIEWAHCKFDGIRCRTGDWKPQPVSNVWRVLLGFATPCIPLSVAGLCWDIWEKRSIAFPNVPPYVGQDCGENRDNTVPR